MQWPNYSKPCPVSLHPFPQPAGHKHHCLGELSADDAALGGVTEAPIKGWLPIPHTLGAGFLRSCLLFFKILSIPTLDSMMMTDRDAIVPPCTTKDHLDIWTISKSQRQTHFLVPAVEKSHAQCIADICRIETPRLTHEIILSFGDLVILESYWECCTLTRGNPFSIFSNMRTVWKRRSCLWMCK